MSGVGPILKFDRVLYNRSRAYDAKTGKCTAKSNGLYQFSVTVKSYGSTLHVAIFKKQHSNDESTLS